MSRKDYEILAKAIYGSLIQSGSLEAQDHFIDQHRMTAKRIAGALEYMNPRFDREKFMKACGVVVLTNTEV